MFLFLLNMQCVYFSEPVQYILKILQHFLKRTITWCYVWKLFYLMYLKKFLPPWTPPEIQTDLSTTGERSYIPPRCLRVSSPDSPKRDAINRLLQTTGIYLQGSTMACSDAYRLRSLLAARCEHTMRKVCKCAAQLSEEATESWDTCVGLRKLLLC